MSGEECKFRLFEAIKVSRNDEVFRLLNQAPGLIDAIHRRDSTIDVAIKSNNLAALLIMRDLLAKNPAYEIVSDPAARPPPSRFLRVAAGLSEWTRAESTWLNGNPTAIQDQLKLVAALEKARSQIAREVGNAESSSPTAKDGFPPSPARMFQVTSGLDEWTDKERKWLKQNPSWIQHQEDLLRVLREAEGKRPETAQETQNRAIRNQKDNPPSRN